MKPTLIAILLGAGTLATSWWLAGFTMTGRRQTLNEAMQWQSAHYDTSFYEGLSKQDYTVKGEGGYALHVQELTSPSPTSRWVIISHGYTDNRMGALKYVPTYLALGYNCVVYDLRGHGLGEPTFTTYGQLEGQDLARLVAEVRRRHPEATQLGLHGESLGAASTISALAQHPEVDFAVSDCAFANIMDVLRDGFRAAHLPAFLANLADLGSRLRFGHALGDMRPIDALAESGVPILYIHGAEDDFIVPQHAERLAAATSATHELWLVPEAGHAESVLKDPEGYAEHLRAFLEEVMRQEQG